jgi:EmrB/QacA subfamily drug resistance transporter
MMIHDTMIIMEFKTVTSAGLSTSLGRWLQDAVAGPRRRWIAVVVVCLGQLMIAVDATIVNVALPSIQHDLGFNQADLTWVVNAYLLTFGGFLLLAGRLGDLIGRKKVFLGGLVLFTAVSVLCGLAQSQAVLIAARALQGIGGAAASAVIVAILVTEFEAPSDRARAMGIYMAVATGGGSLGLLAGGLVTELINWHWIFFINVPIGLGTFLLGSALIAENEGIGLGKGVDVLGSVIVTAATMLGAYAIVTSAQYGWGSAHTLGLGGLALALGAGFIALEARLANPIMPLRILRLRSLMDSSIVRGLMVIGMYSTFFFGALWLEQAHGYGAVATGVAFLPMTLTVASLSLGTSARLMARFGPHRMLLSGMVVASAALLLLSTAGAHTAYFPTVFVALALLGLGVGTAMLPLMTIAMSEVPAADAGLGSGILNVSMWMSAALGLAVLGSVTEGHTGTSGDQLAFVIAAASVAAGAVVALVRLRSPREAAEVAGADSTAVQRGRHERPRRSRLRQRAQVGHVADAAACEQRKLREAAVELSE